MKVFKNYVHYTDPETAEVTHFEPGDECPRELLKVIDPNNLLDPDEQAAEADAAARGVVNYNTLKKEELVVLCVDRGLEADGTKAELIARLEAHDGALS